MALGAVGFLSVLFHRLEVPSYAAIIAALGIIVGTLLISRPLNKRLYNVAGLSLLVAVPLIGLFLGTVGVSNAIGYSIGWAEQIIVLLASIGSVAFLNMYPRDTVMPFRPHLLILIPLLVAAFILPVGSVAALLVMLVGYILGYRNVALIGVLLQIGFIGRFYYDLDVPLIWKSVIMLVSGVIFLVIWWAIKDREAAA